MKALFIHSARFLRTPDGRVFSNGQFPYRRWSRYLKHFNELTVISRMTDCAEAPANWDLSSGPGVTFAGLPDDHGPQLMQLWNEPKLRAIRREMQDSDAVIIRQSRIGWLAAREARRRGIPAAIEVVYDAWDGYWNYGTVAAKLYAPIAWWTARRQLGRANFAIYVTREFLQRRYPCRGVCGNASNVEIYPVPAAVLEQRIAGLSFGRTDSPRPPIVGLIGSLSHRYKGLQVGLRALRGLRDRGMPFHLRVLGDGNLDAWRREAKNLGVADLLRLDGTLPSGEPVMQWLDDLDIYIQPSFQEGLPRGLIEAMSRGLPALGSMCGGIPELLSADCLHRPGDDRTLAGQLARMSHDRAWRIQQAQRNFQEAQNYYADRVEARRDEFWREFAACAAKRLTA